MNKLLLIVFPVFLTTLVFAQDIGEKEFRFWQKNYDQASELYSVVYELNISGASDSTIDEKSKMALVKINQSINHCQEAKKDNPSLKYDADYRLTKSYILGLWFYLSGYSRTVFTDSIANEFLTNCIALRPNVFSIPYYDMKYPVDLEEFNQDYYDQVFIRFVMAYDAGDNDMAYKAGDEYLTNLLIKFDREFPGVIFYNERYFFEQSRVYKIITGLKISSREVRKKLELNLLMIEYFANFYFYQHQEDSSFTLISDEKQKIDSCENYIKKYAGEFLKVEESYLRLADAYFLLGNFEKGISYYSRGIEGGRSDDIRQFIDLTTSYVDTTTNKDFVITSKVLIDNAADKLYKIYSDSDMFNLVNLTYLKTCYEFTGNVNRSQFIQSKLDQLEKERMEEEQKMARREKYGLRIGIAPAKFMFGSLKQVSIMGDLKLNGFEQGVRYCRYNQQVDGFRFGAWAYTGSDETSSNTYDGDEISYWVTLHNIDDGDIEHKFCIEARYGNYRFNSLTTNIVDRETNVIRFYDYEVNPVGHRYDLNIVYRLSLFASEIFFFEFNVSSGIGFRYLTSEFNNDTFIIDDVRFSDDRWPMITAPLRFGLRAGIRFF